MENSHSSEAAVAANSVRRHLLWSEVDLYVRNPRLSISSLNRQIHVHNHPFDLKVAGDFRLGQILDKYLTPQRLPQRSSLSAEDAELFSRLLSHFVLLRESEARFFESGLLQPAYSPMGRPWPVPQLESIPAGAVCVVGAPFDLGSRTGGASQGPRAIRGAFEKYREPLRAAKASDNPELHDFEFRRRYDVSKSEMLDLGNVCHDPMAGAEGFAFRLQWVIERVLAQGAFPVTLGGDHTTTLFCLRALSSQKKTFGLIHFDAHHDLYLNSYLQQTTLNHGNFLAEALSLPGLTQVVNVGGRGTEYLAKHSSAVRDSRVSWMSPLQMRGRTPEDLFGDLPKDLSWYITFDVDVLDSSLVQDTGSPVIGGLGYADVVTAMDYLLAKLHLTGADFVEVKPGDSVRSNFGADISARLILQTVLRNAAYKEI